jgi:glycosyltransferase involved in cell wall biosynthesis
MVKNGLILLPGYELYGQEKALIAIGRLLDKKYRICFLTHKKWGEKINRNLKSLGLNYFPLPMGSIWSISLGLKILIKNFFSIILTLYHLILLFFRNKYDFILIGNATFSVYLIPILIVNKNIKIIYRHGDEIATHSIFHRIINKIIFSLVDIHVVNCLFLRNSLFNNFKINECRLIYNCPVSLYDNYVNRNILDKKNTNIIEILYVGQISKLKGVDILLRAFEMVNSNNKFKLTIIGGFPGVGLAQDFIFKDIFFAALNNSNGSISYKGFSENLNDIYSNSDFLVVPSINDDPSPNVILEGKYFGLPCVSFNVGGIPELIESGFDGVICDEINEKSLANGIERAADLCRYDDKLKQKIIHKFEKDFGIKRFNNQWDEIIQLCV